jgi:tetratricopeptide (TPR) repeat protein
LGFLFFFVIGIVLIRVQNYKWVLNVFFLVRKVWLTNMAWMEETDGNGKEKELGGDNGFLKVKEPSVSSGGSVGDDTVSENQRSEVKDDISYANILRSRNKFADSLALYERVLESDGGNVEALIGKGICLQMQNMGRLAFDSFSEAIKLDPQNACALTHCGILYKDEGRLMEAAEVCTC